MEVGVLTQLLMLNDREFIRAAYRTLLQREPDSSGEANYMQLLRQGIDKIVLLRDMASSPEAQRAGRVVPGLAAALKWHRIKRIPLLGPLAQRLRLWFGRDSDYDPVSAYQNQTLELQRITIDHLSQMRTAAVEDRGRLDQTIRMLDDQHHQIRQFLDLMQDQPASYPPTTALASAMTDRAHTGAPHGPRAAERLQAMLLRKALPWQS